MTTETARINAITYERVHVDDLYTFEKNPRRGDVAKVADSLRLRGQYRPIVVNRGTHTGRDMEVLAGNHTLLAARSLGWQQIDVGIIDVDEQTARGIVLADNRLADLGGYDEATLVELLESLDDMAGTGYDDADLEELLAAQRQPAEQTDRDDAPAVEDTPTISAEGDVYELGPHRDMCGDSTNVEAVLGVLMHDGAADCVWTDPPYGVKYEGKRTARRAIENDDDPDIGDLVRDAMGTAVLAAKPGAPVYMCSPQGPLLHDFQSAFMAAGLQWRQNLVWIKHHFVIGRADYHYKHEPILEGRTPDPPDDGGEEVEVPDHSPLLYGFTPGGEGRLGRGGDRWFGDNKQTTVFDFPKPPSSKDHPTMKPVDLVAAMLANSCRPGGIVLDLFGGSGSTLIAAHHGGQRARLVELDPRYVDVICRRWQEHTGMIPVRNGVEVSFL